MGYITRRDVYLILFEEYEKAKGYKEGTINRLVGHVNTIMNFKGGEEGITREDVERLIEARRARKWYRANLRYAFRHYKEWRDWWESEGIREFEEWLRRQGYSKSTIKEYSIMLRMPGGRRKDTEKERKRLMKVLNAYKRFLREVRPWL